MLFHTWPFLIFLLIVLPVFFALRSTRLWLPWLTLASYCFYGWWNPYYVVLILYSTALIFFVVALMDRCPPQGEDVRLGARLRELRFDDPLTKTAFVATALAALFFLGLALAGPKTLRPVAAGLGVILLLLALGALFRSRGLWLLIGLVTNLAPLLFFKYARFSAGNLNTLLSWLHLPLKLPDPAPLMPFGLQYLLPIGISFYTFQSLSYLIDFHLGKLERERSLLRFANFVCFFPQLLAGPIERAGHMLPQFARFPAIRGQNFTDGLSLFLVGLFKKVALSGYLSFYVERVYDNPGAASGPALLLGTIAFGWQLFFDFSGYADMARGVARFMGFDLVVNFNHPYLADSVADFWRRWHISFSRWILDYIFMPLQMLWRERPRAGTAAALLITFLVSGIWHGAAWTFIIWGLLHGLGLVATRELERSKFYRKRVPRLFKQTAVFFFVTFAWIFFRADSLSDAVLIVQRIATAAWRDPQMPALMLAWIALVWLYQCLCESRLRAALQSGVVRVSLAVSMVLYLWLCAAGGGAFIYFQF
jgi:alginate O-acetyltransferase complex protein AlgI